MPGAATEHPETKSQRRNNRAQIGRPLMPNRRLARKVSKTAMENRRRSTKYQQQSTDNREKFDLGRLCALLVAPGMVQDAPGAAPEREKVSLGPILGRPGRAKITQ